MTKLTRPVRRETHTPLRWFCMYKAVRRRTPRFDVTLYPRDVIGLRAKGRRLEYRTTLAAVFDLAVETFAAAQRAEKQRQRKANRKGTR